MDSRADGAPVVPSGGARCEDGSPILLLDQDRSKWDPVHIVRGFAALDQAQAPNRLARQAS